MNSKKFSNTEFFFYVLYFLGGYLQTVFLISIISKWLWYIDIGKDYAFIITIIFFILMNIVLGKIFLLKHINRVTGFGVVFIFLASMSFFQGAQSIKDCERSPLCDSFSNDGKRRIEIQESKKRARELIEKIRAM